MVRGLILKRQLTCRGYLLRVQPRQDQFYPVLAPLSRGYPRFEGRLPTRYSPVRHFTLPTNRNFSFDLHVLGTPPAFILSQDQTLQLNYNPTNRQFPYSVFKEQNCCIINYIDNLPFVKGNLFSPPPIAFFINFFPFLSIPWFPTSRPTPLESPFLPHFHPMVSLPSRSHHYLPIPKILQLQRLIEPFYALSVYICSPLCDQPSRLSP
jgi:hypothetical protein